jgi:hypothetical protein
MRGVELGQLGQEDRRRRAVEDDAVERQHQHVLHGPRPYHRRPEDRTLGEVERGVRLRGHLLPDQSGPLRRPGPADVEHRQRHVRPGHHHLDRSPTAVGKPGTQDVVPGHDVPQRSLEHTEIEGAGEPQDERDGARRASRL